MVRRQREHLSKRRALAAVQNVRGQSRQCGRKLEMAEGNPHVLLLLWNSRLDGNTSKGPGAPQFWSHLLWHLHCEGQSLLWSRWGAWRGVKKAAAPHKGKAVWMSGISDCQCTDWVGSTASSTLKELKGRRAAEYKSTKFLLASGPDYLPYLSTWIRPNISSSLAFMSFQDCHENLNWLTMASSFGQSKNFWLWQLSEGSEPRVMNNISLSDSSRCSILSP